MVKLSVSVWHCVFLGIILVLVLLAAYRRYPDAIADLLDEAQKDPDEPDYEDEDVVDVDDEQDYDQNDDDTDFPDESRRRRRDTEIEREHFFEIDLNHLHYMENYISPADIQAILRSAKSHQAYAHPSGEEPGELYAMAFNNHEVNLTRLDRNTLNRVEIEIVVNRMKQAVPNLGAKIERLIAFEAAIQEAKSKSGGELRRARLIDAHRICLLERNVVCNQHLPRKFHCTCHVVPHLAHKLQVPRCDDIYRISDVSTYVLTYAMLFPVPEIMTILADAFFTEFLTYYTTFIRNSSRLIVLRRNCVSRRLFAFQVALLKNVSFRSGRNTPPPFIDTHFEELSVERLRGERASLTQPLVHHVSLRQFSTLMPTNVEETAWYMETIARVQRYNCEAQLQWDYKIFLLCRTHELGYLIICGLGIGTLLGILRFYHFYEASVEHIERQRQQLQDQEASIQLMPSGINAITEDVNDHLSLADIHEIVDTSGKHKEFHSIQVTAL